MTRYGCGTRAILLVEDSPADAELIEDLLVSDSGARDRVTVAPSLAAACARLRAASFDAVLLDLRLPDGFGVECVVAARAVAANVPIVVLTGVDDTALAVACISAGAQDYLCKQDVNAQSVSRGLAYAMARRHAESAQAHLAAIVESSSDGIVSTSTEGLLTTWNGGARQIFGYTSAEAIGRHFTEVVRAADEDGLREQLELMQALLRHGEPRSPREVVCLHRDGRPLVLSIVLSRMLDGSGRPTALAATFRDVTLWKQRDDELRRSHEALLLRDRQMRALAARLTAVREEERTRISREVHDELGQRLTAVKMDLRAVRRRLKEASVPAATAIEAKLQDADQLVDDTVAAVQRIAVELRPSALDALGLAAAIRDEARRFEQRSGIATGVSIPVETPVPRVLATELFRILQELLTNVARHARASGVWVALECGDACWVLRVRDDGVGPYGEPGAGLGPADRPRATPQRVAALGLLGISERVAALGGRFTLGRAPGGGALATVEVPLHAGEQACATS